jgi:hypothetical protein
VGHLRGAGGEQVRAAAPVVLSEKERAFWSRSLCSHSCMR